MPIHAITLAATLASAAPASVLDLALTDVAVVGVTLNEDLWEVQFQYTVQNIGDIAFNPEGPSKDTDFDNAVIQTYLWDNAGGALIPAAGWAILDAPIIAPGESFSGIFTSNSFHLPDPLDFGTYTWLVVDLLGTGEEPEYMANNRAIVHIPAPGTACICGLGLLAANRRRR